jgi:sec-independent protein translocase protein TatB
MLEVGWSEILVIIIILIVVVGPKDLPKMLRTFATMSKKIRGMATEFQGQFNEALKDAELDDVRKSIQEVRNLNPANALKDAFNPLRQAGEDVKRELQKSQNEINAKAAATLPVAAAAGATAATAHSPAAPVAAAETINTPAPAPSFTPPPAPSSLGSSPPPSLVAAAPKAAPKPKTNAAKTAPKPEAAPKKAAPKKASPQFPAKAKAARKADGK